MDNDPDGWIDPDDQMGVWEHQGRPLTVQWLRIALGGLDGAVPVRVEFFDGVETRELRAMHIDLRGHAGSPTAVVVTVA